MTSLEIKTAACIALAFGPSVADSSSAILDDAYLVPAEVHTVRNANALLPFAENSVYTGEVLFETNEYEQIETIAHFASSLAANIVDSPPEITTAIYQDIWELF